MKVLCIPVGYLQANCYILIKDNNALIIDPGSEEEKIEKHLKGLNVLGILVTHYHFDHIGALDYLKNKYNLKVNETFNPFKYEIIKTPGHTKDSITLYFSEENIMFTGDFLFKDSIGRMDLEGGSVKDMINSLVLISKYNDDIVVYPGHGKITTLKNEKVNIKSDYLNFGLK